MPKQRPNVPRATYRLQFHSGFTFNDAIAIVPYLAELGISHVYASPYLKARPGSLHGYDIIDHNAINPEIGDSESFAAFCAVLAVHGMGQILDFVPNHIGIFGAENLGSSTCSTGARTRRSPISSTSTGGRRSRSCSGKLLVPAARRPLRHDPARTAS